MPKKRKSLTKEEIESIAQYQWASIKDIMDIGSIGRNKARNIFNLIGEQYFSDKYRIKNGLIPMDLVLEYFNISLKNMNVNN